MAHFTPAPKVIAMTSQISTGTHSNTSAVQKPRHGAQLNGLKFSPRLWCRLFIWKNVTKATEANSCIISPSIFHAWINARSYALEPQWLRRTKNLLRILQRLRLTSYDLNFIEGFLHLQVVAFIVHPLVIFDKLWTDIQSALSRH